MTDAIVTRFPPSPTGYLHIGGARTALFNWALARSQGGRFFLRMEDTDRARSTAAAARSIIDDLRWLGIDWDNAGQEPRQSEQAERGVYNEHVERLLADGQAYEDDGAIRFTMPDGQIAFDDIVRGTVTTDCSQIEPFVIRKTDGMPTYHLAVVVDDADMGITHVIRGADHLTNTPKHIALQRALALPTPTYGHISLTTNPDGSKLGKRDKAKAARAAALDAGLAQLDRVEAALFKAFMSKQSDDVEVAIAVARHIGLDLPEIDVRDFRASGYLPGVIVNYLSLLGWNPGGDVERFGADPLAFVKEHFDPRRFIKGNATFDRGKLAAFNAEAIREMPAEQWRIALWEHNAEPLERVFDGVDDQRFAAFAQAYHERSRTLADPLKQGAFFFAPTQAIVYDFAAKAVAKAMKGEPGGAAALRMLRPELAALPAEGFGAAAHDAIKALAEAQDINMGKLAQPLRVAISGGTVTPPIDATLDILGKDATLERIDRCLAAMDQ